MAATTSTSFNPDRYASREDVQGPMWDLNNIPNLSGKVALVTGANSPSGIGFHMAHHLLLHNCTVYIGARSNSSYHLALSDLQSLTPSIPQSHIRPFIADLRDLRAVRAAALKVLEEQDRLDILINNAGLLARPLDLDSNGLSVSMVVNHLAAFLLTTTLLPLLEKTAKNDEKSGVRVVMLSSTTHAAVPEGTALSFKTKEDFNVELGGRDDFASNFARYGLSKLANLFFAKELQRRWNEAGVQGVAVAVHPGGIRTKGAHEFVGENKALLDGSMEVEDGARTALFAATSPEVWKEKDKFGGAYVMPFGVVVGESEMAKDARLARELWEGSVRVLDEVLKEE